MKTILNITAYTATENELYKLNKPYERLPSYHFFNRLPVWCVTGDGRIDETRNWHQFSGTLPPDEGDGETFIFFNVEYMDGHLDEEISNMGLYDFFKEVNFARVFNHIQINNEVVVPNIPFTTHVVIGVDYERCYDGEVDLTIALIGYLDDNLTLKEV